MAPDVPRSIPDRGTVQSLRDPILTRSTPRASKPLESRFSPAPNFGSKFAAPTHTSRETPSLPSEPREQPLEKSSASSDETCSERV